MGVEMMRKAVCRLSTAVLVLGLIGIVKPAQAALLPPGGFLGPAPAEVHPGAGSVIPVGGQLLNVPFVATNGLFSGTLSTTVFQDTTNVFGAGRLTFVYQVTNNVGSTNPLTRFSTDPFAGFLTDASYVGGTGWAPGTIDRPTAPVVGFTFGTLGPGPLPANTTSAQLVIQTNATAFQQAFAQVIGGGQAPNILTLGPIPEPTSLGLLGLLGALALRRR